MCKCTPSIKTPWCGKPGCEMPEQIAPDNVKHPLPKIKHIFADMDGVIVNFPKGVEKVLAVDLSELDRYEIDEYLGISTSEFWKAIDEVETFWEDLEPYPWTIDLIEMLLEVSNGNLTIATSPSADPHCACQKLKWIQKHLPAQLYRKVLIGPQKHLLAAPGRVLIDDSPEKTSRFQQAGGIAILFPQPYNTGIKEDDMVSYIYDWLHETSKVMDLVTKLHGLQYPMG